MLFSFTTEAEVGSTATALVAVGPAGGATEVDPARRLPRLRPAETHYWRAWRELDSLLPAARLDRYPRRGTRLNAFLSVATLAVYRAVIGAGIDKRHAIGLVADAG